MKGCGREDAARGAAARGAYERGRRALGAGYVRKVAFDYCADAGDGERVEVCYPVWHCPRLRVVEGRRARLARALRRLAPSPSPGHGRAGGTQPRSALALEGTWASAHVRPSARLTLRAGLPGEYPRLPRKGPRPTGVSPIPGQPTG